MRRKIFSGVNPVNSLMGQRKNPMFSLQRLGPSADRYRLEDRSELLHLFSQLRNPPSLPRFPSTGLEYAIYRFKVFGKSVA